MLAAGRSITSAGEPRQRSEDVAISLSSSTVNGMESPELVWVISG